MATKVKYYSPKRRAIYAAGETIDPMVVFDRDDWTCRLCDKKINRRLRYPAWLCATIDHVVPICTALEMGWPLATIHTYENVQAAHRRCNELKSNTFDGTLVPMVDL
jgi:5-methylcytosine-specific restriction endonuclease McrA